MSGKRDKPEASSNPPKKPPVHPKSEIDSKHDVRPKKKPGITEKQAPVLRVTNLMMRLGPSDSLLKHKAEIKGYLQAGGPFDKLPEAVKQDKEVAIWAIRKGYPYKNLHETLKQDQDIALWAVRVDPKAFDDVPDVFKQDEQFAEKVVEARYNLYARLPDEMKQKTSVALKAIKGNSFHVIDKLHPACWQDAAIVDSILDEDLIFFERVSEDLRKDIDFVSSVLDKVFEVVEDEMSDPDDIKDPVSYVLPYVGENILNDPDFWVKQFNVKCANLPENNVALFLWAAKKHISKECQDSRRFTEATKKYEREDDNISESSAGSSPSP